MKKLKALLSSTLVTAACFALLAGCSDSSTSSTKNSDKGSTSAKKITVTMQVAGNKAASGQDFELDILPKLVHQHFPNITLEVQKLPDDQYNTSMKTKLAVNQAPDILYVWPRMANASNVITLGKNGYLADLSDLPFMKNLAQGVKDDMSSDGKVYAVAHGLDMLGTYYNKDLFAKVGISEVPTDWDTFLADCQKLKAAGITPIVMGDKDSWWIQFGLYQIAANTVYSDEKDFDTKLQNGEETLNGPKWQKAVSMYKELYDKGYIVKNSLGLGGPQAIQQFVDGKAAMTFDGTWDYTPLTAKGAVDFQRGFFPLPANEKGQPVFEAAATAAGWAVNAKSPNVDAVKKIFDYWFDGQSDLYQAWLKSESSIIAFDGVPLTHDLFSDAFNQYKSTGNAIYFANQMWPSGVDAILESKFAEIIGKQGTTPANMTKAMQDKFQELWKK
jgi:raffinose/stachyose/melibiose transport system substrate-binding protein